MPYLKEGRKKEVRSEHKRAIEPGDWNYLFTLEYIKAFIGDPRYAMIHRIGKASKNPHYLLNVQELEDYLTVLGVTLDDRAEAREEAMAEFRRRIVGPYEDMSIKVNGDLAEYEELQKIILKKFGATS